ncbi:MAG TPA: DUF6559 family protein [Rhizomicrobium sp.]|jgi:hypothetical protein
MLEAWRRWRRGARFKRAAKAYATRLPPELARNFSRREIYTRPQIERGIESARLDNRYAALAYARYMAAEDFDRIQQQKNRAKEASHQADEISYQEARSLFLANEPVILGSRNDPMPLERFDV